MKAVKKIFKDKNSFEKLSDLIGRTVILTFRGKSITQYKKYEVLSIAEGFLRLEGIDQNDTRPKSAPYYQAISEIDTLTLSEG